MRVYMGVVNYGYVRRNASGTVIVNPRIFPPTFENKMQAKKKLTGGESE